MVATKYYRNGVLTIEKVDGAKSTADLMTRSFPKADDRETFEEIELCAL